MAGSASIIELLRNQNPTKWELVTDGSGPYKGGLYCNQGVTLTLTDSDGNPETFDFLQGAFIPLSIAEVASGATGNGVIGFNG